ncbi:hypothetical protein AtNW77_Chr2g0249631 [Arabidopsis thaliana]
MVSKIIYGLHQIIMLVPILELLPFHQQLTINGFIIRILRVPVLELLPFHQKLMVNCCHILILRITIQYYIQLQHQQLLLNGRHLLILLMDPLTAALQTLPDDMLQELYQQCQRQSQLQQNFSLEEQQRLQCKVNNNGLQGVVRPPEKPPQDLYGQCQPQSQLQQNLSVEELQRLEVEYRANSNELQGVIPQQQHHQEQEAMQTQGYPLNRIPVQSEASNHSDSGK